MPMTQLHIDEIYKAYISGKPIRHILKEFHTNYRVIKRIQIKLKTEHLTNIDKMVKVFTRTRNQALIKTLLFLKTTLLVKKKNEN